MKFKLKKLALLTEILGGIAILVSLIIVIIQLRENTKATRSATATAIIGTMTDWYVTIGSDSETSRAFYQFLTDPESMSREEQLQHILSLHGQFLTFQNSYYLSLEGTLDKRIPESLNQIIAGVKEQPGFLVFWNARKSIFFQEYRDYVDAIIASDQKASEGIFEKEDVKQIN